MTVPLASRLFASTLLQWREPSAFQQARSDAEASGWRRIFIATLAVCVPFLAYVAWTAPVLLPRLGAVIALVLAYLWFVSFSYRTFPTWVWITDAGVSHGIRRKNCWRWSYASTDHFEVVTGTPPVLVLVSRDGQRFTIGVAPTVDLAALAQMLERRGVRVDVHGG